MVQLKTERFHKLMTKASASKDEGVPVYAYALTFDKNNLENFSKGITRLINPFRGRLFRNLTPLVREEKNGKLLKKEIRLYPENRGCLKVFEDKDEMIDSFTKDLICFEKAKEEMFKNLNSISEKLKQSLNSL